MIGGKHLEDVEEFTYFGTNVTTTGDWEQEINTMISKANQAYAILKHVWRATNISVHTENKIFRSNVLSIPLYGTECWKTTATIPPKFEVLQTKRL